MGYNGISNQLIMQKLIELDLLSGEEYMMGDIEWYVKDIDQYYEDAEDASVIYQYDQLELAKKYARTYCTIYWPMAALATKTGYNLSIAEREELIKLRKAENDFSEATGGQTARWVDVIRRWWNTHHPENPVVSFAISNLDDLRLKLFSRKIPIVTSFRGNLEWGKDISDGIVNKKTWWTPTYGHCRMMTGLTIYDNYKPKDWKRYSYPSIEHYFDVLKNWYERPQAFVFFLENELSQKGKKLVQAMKLGLRNGERENDLLTRWEASRIAMRIAFKKVTEEDVWNGKDWEKPVSKYEYSAMLHRCNEKCKIYTDVDRNKTITRREAILLLP